MSFATPDVADAIMRRLRETPRPHFSDRPLGFDPLWIVRHRVACEEPPTRLAVPRYIGGSVAVHQQPGAGREGGAT